MDSAYANALKRKEELERELGDIETFLALYQRFQGNEVKEDIPNSLKQEGDAFVQDGFGRQVRVLRPAEIADMAEKVIRGADEPLTRAEIVRRIERSGNVVLNSEDKARYVGTILWRQKERFTNIPGKGYITTSMATRDQRYQDVLMVARGDEEPDDGSETGEAKKSD